MKPEHKQSRSPQTPAANGRFKAFKKLEKFITWIITRPTTWASKKGSTQNAWCDGLLLGDAPWICYCCIKMRKHLRGQKTRRYLKECNPMNLGILVWPTIFTSRIKKVTWVWPAEKWVYPIAFTLPNGGETLNYKRLIPVQTSKEVHSD